MEQKIIDEIIQMVKQNPNDLELGGKIREYVYQLQKEA
jgi:hypothetical protein